MTTTIYLEEWLTTQNILRIPIKVEYEYCKAEPDVGQMRDYIEVENISYDDQYKEYVEEQIKSENDIEEIIMEQLKQYDRG